MIALAALLVLVAVALLVGGLGNGDTTLLWVSVGVSVLAGVVLLVQTTLRSRTAAATAGESAGSTSKAAVAQAMPVSSADPVRTTPAADGASSTGDGPLTALASGTAAPAATADSPPSGVPASSAPAGSPGTPSAEGPASEESVAAAVGSHAARPVGADGPVVAADEEPPEEEVEVTDLLLVLDLTDEVVVVDEHPRYHLAGCTQTAGQEEIPVPMDEAREDGFTACGACGPDRHLAEIERGRRAAERG